MKWTIKRNRYLNGYFWEATRPDGMWIMRRHWNHLIDAVIHAEKYQVARRQLYKQFKEVS